MGIIEWIVRWIRRRREERIKPYEVIERSEAKRKVMIGRVERWRKRAYKSLKPKTAYEKKLWSEKDE